MKMVTPEQIERLYRLTDEFGLLRDAVIVPLEAAPEGKVLVLPDGKVVLRPPAGEAFEGWFIGLRRELEATDFSRTPKAGQPFRWACRG